MGFPDHRGYYLQLYFTLDLELAGYIIRWI